jgi:hypothetical protein
LLIPRAVETSSVVTRLKPFFRKSSRAESRRRSRRASWPAEAGLETDKTFLVFIVFIIGGQTAMSRDYFQFQMVQGEMII